MVPSRHRFLRGGKGIAYGFQASSSGRVLYRLLAPAGALPHGHATSHEARRRRRPIEHRRFVAAPPPCAHTGEGRRATDAPRLHPPPMGTIVGHVVSSSRAASGRHTATAHAATALTRPLVMLVRSVRPPPSSESTVEATVEAGAAVRLVSLSPSSAPLARASLVGLTRPCRRARCPLP